MFPFPYSWVLLNCTPVRIIKISLHVPSLWNIRGKRNNLGKIAARYIHQWKQSDLRLNVDMTSTSLALSRRKKGQFQSELLSPASFGRKMISARNAFSLLFLPLAFLDDTSNSHTQLDSFWVGAHQDLFNQRRRTFSQHESKKLKHCRRVQHSQELYLQWAFPLCCFFLLSQRMVWVFFCLLSEWFCCLAHTKQLTLSAAV